MSRQFADLPEQPRNGQLVRQDKMGMTILFPKSG